MLPHKQFLIILSYMNCSAIWTIFFQEYPKETLKLYTYIYIYITNLISQIKLSGVYSMAQITFTDKTKLEKSANTFADL